MLDSSAVMRRTALDPSGAPSLAVITHSSDAFWHGKLLIHLLIQRWREMGVRVEVLCEKDEFVPADAALLHVDLSVIPEECLELANRYPVVINGRVLDIRKRHLTTQRVDVGSGTVGPVIVKTDCNYGGLSEFRRNLLASPFTAPLVRSRRLYAWLQAMASRRRWSRRRLLAHYPIYPDVGEVPKGVWRNPNLVVERFVAERDGPNYCCRCWLFFGPHEVSRRLTSANPIVKASTRIEPLADPVPDELRTIRRRLGFDYGKFDYAIVSGQLVLFDVNRTPGATGRAANHADTIGVLSEGLLSFLPERPRPVASDAGHAPTGEPPRGQIDSEISSPVATRSSSS